MNRIEAKKERYTEMPIGPQSRKTKAASEGNIHTFKHSRPHGLCHLDSLAPETKGQYIHTSKALKATEWTSQLVASFPEKHSYEQTYNVPNIHSIHSGS